MAKKEEFNLSRIYPDHVVKQFQETYKVNRPAKWPQIPAHISNVGRSPLDTLETTSETLQYDGDAKKDPDRLMRRARRKVLSGHLAVSLAMLKTSLEKQYRDTFYCSHTISVIGDKAKSSFCKRKWCMVCSSIRIAQLINRYLPTIDSWKDKHLLTLTVKNVSEQKLPETLEKMYLIFTEIKDSERKAGRNLVGLRKLEITYNSDEDNYHPHFHFILKSADSCEELIRRWLYKFNPAVQKKDIDEIQKEIQKRLSKGKSAKKYLKLNKRLEAIRKILFADPQFQDYKPADNKTVKYLFKYLVKLNSSKREKKAIYVNAIDVMYRNLYNRRSFQTFGFVPHVENHAPENIEQLKEELLEELIYTWDSNVMNWVNQLDGDLLTNYAPSENDVEYTKKLENGQH